MTTATLWRSIIAVLSLASLPGLGQAPVSERPAYSASGDLRFPEKYREWVFLSSGVNMSYSPNAGASEPNVPIFDNVFVNPESYRAFLKEGKWRDGTTMILEIRRGSNKGSINQAGHFQGPDLRDIEVHVKDSSRFPDGGWAFFGFDKAGQGGKIFARTAGCYSCHVEHGAVDTTFTQFYPTLLPIAKAKGTLSKSVKPEDAQTAGAKP